MRLLTLKLHRAFPELDRFDDYRAASFVAAAARYSALSTALTAVACLTTLFVVTIIAMILTVALLNVIDKSRRSDLSVVVAIVLPVLAGGVSAFIVRDLLLRRRIWSILADQARCVQCHYELLGLKRDASGMVRCPECGALCEMDESFDRLSADPTGDARLEAFISQSRPIHAPEVRAESPLDSSTDAPPRL